MKDATKHYTLQCTKKREDKNVTIYDDHEEERRKKERSVYKGRTRHSNIRTGESANTMYVRKKRITSD